MPRIPVDMHANQVASWIFLVAMGAFFALSLSWSIQQHRRAVPWLAPLALVGGCIASLEESWIDVQIQLWYPKDAPATLFTILGNHQPLYLHFAYAGFVGLGAYVVYRGLVANPDGRLLWPTFLAICALDLCFELPATLADVYHYYGAQPFQLTSTSWPLWVAPINAAGPVLGGFLIYRLAPHLTGRRLVLIALLPPLAYSGVYGATAWPAVSMLKSDTPSLAKWVGALITMLLATSVVVLTKLTLPKAGSHATQPNPPEEVALDLSNTSFR